MFRILHSPYLLLLVHRLLSETFGAGCDWEFRIVRILGGGER